MTMSAILRRIRFIRHMKPQAIVGRVAHGVKAKVVARFPDVLPRLPVIPEAINGPAVHAFSSHWAHAGDRFYHSDEIKNGVFHTKAARADFGSLEAMDWTPRFQDQPELANWAYDFASFSYASKLVTDHGADGVRIVAQLVQLLELKHPIGGARLHFVWTPISVALRIMGLTSAASLALRQLPLPAKSDIDAIRAHIALCERYLSVFAERYLGYNHAAFGLVSLCVAHVALRGPHNAGTIASEALACLEEQVLDDGLQAERTATYHLHVLNLGIGLLALDALSEAQEARLRILLAKMTSALDVLVHPDEEIAIFNDSAIADATPPSAVGWKRSADQIKKASLPAAGYAKLSSPSSTVIFDAGRMGPEDVIGHGHGDFLSVEVSAGGQRFVVDPGVRSYSAGRQRDLTRSSYLHNGPTYEGLEPAEFFGAWRVGWRGGANLTADRDLPNYLPLETAGIADGYDRAGGRVARYVGMDPTTGSIEILDSWRIFPDAKPVLRWLVPACWDYRQLDDQELEFKHVQTAQTVRVRSSNFQIASIASSEWHPKGPMEPNVAHLFTLEPRSVPGHATAVANQLSITPDASPDGSDRIPSLGSVAIEAFLKTGRIAL